MQSLHQMTTEKEASDITALWDTWGNSVNCANSVACTGGFWQHKTELFGFPPSEQIP